ncbi:MAG: hypothetical protein BAJALOKI1v1_450028 [Promethearchaeota archaeon]|nr:MAG: hypothetical protein BAJALOKI1v1_450028 [Candidatus Lokiarchaeota archaeon]
MQFRYTDSELKRYAVRAKQSKGKKAFKLAASIVSTKLTKIVYAILRDGVPFNPEPSKAFKGASKDKDTKRFSLIHRRLIRRARKVL